MRLKCFAMKSRALPRELTGKVPSSGHPRSIIEDVYGFERYRPEASPLLKGYAILQLLASTALLLFMFQPKGLYEMWSKLRAGMPGGALR